jgi:hypothetical protein
MENKLRPIYQAIDGHQYSKALKATLGKPQNTWPITIALRSHCLERCGPSRYREACIELRNLLGIFGNDKWEELDERIWLLSLDSNTLLDIHNATTASVSASTSANGTHNVTDAVAGNNISSSSNTNGGKKGKGKKAGKGKKTKSNTAPLSTTASSSSASEMTLAATQHESLDIIHVLDMPIYERYQYFKKNVQPASNCTSTVQPMEITDETTLATLAISINSLHLPRTLAKLYSCAIQTLQTHVQSCPSHSPPSPDINESLYNLLIQGYLSDLKLISTMVEYAPNSHNLGEKISNARTKVDTWQDAQFHAMGLVKVSGERLYQNWMILAIMEHHHAARELFDLLEKQSMALDADARLCIIADVVEEKMKLSKKMGMLPRLAEMVTVKQIQSFTNDEGGFPPSADDVRLFVECFEMRSKFQEAVDFLDQIGWTSQDGQERERRQIEDENDVKDHVGSVIQLTEKERLEMKVRLLKKMDRYEEVFDIYCGELLVLLPDQWSYWKDLLECAAILEDDVHACVVKCQIVLDRILKEEEEKAANGEGPKVPLRGPHLFVVELVAYMIKDGDVPSAIANLSEAIVKFGSLYAPLVFCCFQDLRVYIQLLVERSCENGSISSEVQKVLDWAVGLHELNNPVMIGDGDSDQEKKSNLRNYIASIKFCFEIWHQLCSQCKDDIEASESIDNSMASFVPSPEEMISCWKNTMDLGNNAKDGGQKECLPGDDLVLLTVQLLSHRNRFEQEDTRKQMSLYASAILENALIHSPYNAYLKIAAVKNHFLNGSGLRAIEVFDDMNVKQIQLDSCSYFVLRNLVDCGLYKEAIDHAGNVVRLHSTSEKDLCSYMPRSFENGNTMRGREMMNWQQNQMSQSLQLLEAKGLIMDLAPLLNYGNSDDPQSFSPIGIVCGLVGSKNDEERAEKILRDSTNFFAAPSVLNVAAESACIKNVWSDNRDFSVHEYEILEKSTFILPPQETVMRAHEHRVLAKLVLVAQSIKPLKKGKIVKVRDGEVIDIRSKSLCQSIASTETYLTGSASHCSQAHLVLLKATLVLSKAFSIIVSGREDSNAPIDPSDSLTKREERVIPLLTEVTLLLKESASTWNDHSRDEGTSALRLLPDILITLFATLKTTANASATFGWGKRKRATKPVAGCLAEVAASFQVLVEDLRKAVAEQFATISDLDYSSETRPRCMDLIDGEEMLKKVMSDIRSYRQEILERMHPLLKEIKNELETYDATD